MKKKVLVSTVPFGEVLKTPITILEDAGLEVVFNPHGRRMNEDELIQLIGDVDYFIAGLDKITERVLDEAKQLKLIARVGVGVDNIPFEQTIRRGIQTAYTPNAGTTAVAELTIGLLLDCARQFTRSDRDMRNGVWNKYIGTQLKGKTIGIIGAGRIGKAVIQLLQTWGMTVLANDLIEVPEFAKEFGFTYVSKEELYSQSDFITLHVNHSNSTFHLINEESIQQMKKGVCIINASRGEVVDEKALFDALQSGQVSCAAIDVFAQEPYTGMLLECPQVILTAHIGAATTESRLLMELGASEEVVRFHTGKPLKNPINHG